MTTRRWYATRGTGTAARIVSGIGALFALIIVIYILLMIFGANMANAFSRFIQSMAEPLALFFPGLFPIANATLNVIVNYGLAALFWIVVTGIIARVVS
ncbi:hypothetical protein SAMN05192558_109239 [Actinokineospora alba]|uniref:YGGT family protein n=1 Tax=Actinokineospora alba TaxID=504798 RepID=A0A1H0T2P1_9PSEU|nr:hypothetical protein [Actinokineospora alba]TDP66394.1 hypothetical protein C8E96_1901 [Actinokineospora alba]SDJ23954.1 hypothetical protein SAMN05421871_111135 [Actinokineospora alba]SDP48347.1 hypothetical protein SAMN05192558_109239 [Actinokineospora alba]